MIRKVRASERLAEYAKRMGLTREEAENTPNEDIQYALMIWRLDDQHDKLKSVNKA